MSDNKRKNSGSKSKRRNKNKNKNKNKNESKRLRVEVTEQQDGQSNLKTILKKLESPQSQDRAWAATVISQLIDNSLYSDQVIATLLTHLDDDENVVIEVLGALRNTLLLCSSALAYLYSQDGINKIINVLAKNQNDLLLEQGLACLLSLAEEYLLASKSLIGLLFRFLDVDTLIVVTLKLMMILSEESQPFTDLLNLDQMNQLLSRTTTTTTATTTFDDNNSDIMIDWTDTKSIEIILLTLSILFNINASIPDDKNKLLCAKRLKLIDDILNYEFNDAWLSTLTNAGQAVDKAIEKSNISRNEQIEKIGDLELSEVHSNEKKYIQDVESHLLIIQMALELLANIYSDQDQDDVNEAGGINIDNDPHQDEEMKSKDSNDSILADFIINSGIISKLESKIKSLAAISIPCTSCSEIKSILDLIQTRSLVCLSNICLQYPRPTKLWSCLVALLRSAVAVDAESEKYDATLTALWTLSKQTLSCSIEELEFLLGINDLQMIKILSSYARFNIEFNRRVLEYYIQILRVGDIEMTAEVVDVIFDLFGDSFAYEANFWEMGIIDLLHGIDYGGGDERFDDIFENIDAFIQYKLSNK